MLPKYENGDVIVVYSEQRHPVSSLLWRRSRGAAEDRRALPEDHREGKIAYPWSTWRAFNAKAINGVKLEWIGEIFVTLPRGQIHRMRAKTAGRTRKAGKSK